jgi:hypothetical protein
MPLNAIGSPRDSQRPYRPRLIERQPAGLVQAMYQDVRVKNNSRLRHRDYFLPFALTTGDSRWASHIE